MGNRGQNAILYYFLDAYKILMINIQNDSIKTDPPYSNGLSMKTELFKLLRNMKAKPTSQMGAFFTRYLPIAFALKTMLVGKVHNWDKLGRYVCEVREVGKVSKVSKVNKFVKVSKVIKLLSKIFCLIIFLWCYRFQFGQPSLKNFAKKSDPFSPKSRRKFLFCTIFFLKRFQ